MTSEEIRKRFIRITADSVYLKVVSQSFRVYQVEDEEDLRTWYADQLTKALVNMRADLIEDILLIIRKEKR